ncbi:acyltransferase family protein [Nocardiopsis aegyptia]|uniref:Peptidoglycan/LPS O-acetylase OafA/YrhL n=1 Tax=Nocardiopsis aegyptia TaxID=220378 RepID=A0A7Z0ELT6_9ACTN|nr:peptidoglycan/LPS O-acetylase OafA/YrhL [Nocardiopsis aegyptia]
MPVPVLNHAPEHVRGASASPRTAHRTDIEGLRAVAALLIAVYHIWFGTVSGGVDVFLVLTGFLITGSLVRAMERDGRLALGAFWSKLARRLFPSGAVVLAAVLVSAYLLLPRSRWTDVIADVQAAALYYGNWHLSLGSVDYMAENSAAGPVQHFWSLGVQGQFYLLWPVLVILAGLVAARCGLRVRTAALAAVGAVLATSFAYSLWITSTDPVWAYFDTGARLWELALGGVLALVIARVRLPRPLRLVLGWTGLAALVLCGLVVGDSLPYPGVASLWPALAAVAVLLAGAGGDAPGRLSATRLLGARPLVWLGGRAYTLFLWHWPILVFHLEVTGQDRPTLLGGLGVLGCAFAAAVLTTRLVDGSLTRLTRTRRAPSWSLAAGVLFVVPVLLAGLVWGGAIERDRQLRMELSSDPMSYPGAAVTLNPALAENLPALPVYPDTATVATDTVDQTRDCNALTDATEVVSCDFGDPEAGFTMVLAGSSHARHWFQALRAVVEQHDWRLIMMTKNACQFSADEQVYRGVPFTECTAWNADVMERIAEIGPDAVFTTATRTTAGGEEEDPPGTPPERTPDGYVERWRELEELGVAVLAVRDTPRFGFDVAECVDREGARGCVEEQSFSMAERAPYEDLADVPANTRFLDLTEHLCGDGVCRGVIGNQLAYYDTNHFSHAFSRSLAVVLEPYLLESLPEAPVAGTSLAEAAGPLLGAAESTGPEAS